MAVDFEGRVVIVTGAGGRPGIGRAHALLLASLGARVVVNDLGVGPDGRGDVPANAAQVVEEIVAAGGQAVADAHSVSNPQGAASLVETALNTWGRLDAVINNAGVMEYAYFEELSPADIEKVIGVHLFGTIWVCRAAWPHLKRSGAGRIVNTVSGALLGGRYASVYGAAKGGILALTRTLAIEGEPDGIKVNAFGPGAVTVAWHTTGAAAPPEHVVDKLRPELVAPVAAYLAHPLCQSSGKCVMAEAGRVFETFYGQTVGFEDAHLTVDSVAERWADVVSRHEFRDVGDPREGGGGFSLNPRAYVPSDERESRSAEALR